VVTYAVDLKRSSNSDVFPHMQHAVARSIQGTKRFQSVRKQATVHMYTNRAVSKPLTE
jgi:hypothetical protein